MPERVAASDCWIEQRGKVFVVLDRGGRVVGPGYSNRQAAAYACTRLKYDATCVTRLCMSCRAEFQSEVTHNRLCQVCKKRGD